MKRVLITGATGFIGRQSIPLLLANGYEVHAVSMKAPTEPAGNLRWYQVDLLEPSQTAALVAQVQPTHLLHFAWYVKPGKFWQAPENIDWVRASLALLQSFSLCGGQRVVMAGTCAEYNWRYGYCSEHLTPLVPNTLYGVCKYSLQRMLEAFAVTKGLSAAWGRIFLLYGVGEPAGRLTSSVICSLLKGKPALCSYGNQIRDFLYVEDVAAAFVSLLDSNVTGPVNVASGLPVKIKDLVLTIAEKLGGNNLIEFGAQSSPAGEPCVLLADTTRLTNEVGWTPIYDLESGLERTINWWKAQLAG